MTYPHLKTKGKKVQGVDEEEEEKDCSFIDLGALEVQTEDTGALGLLQKCLCPPGLGITVPVCVPALSNIIASPNNQADSGHHNAGVAKDRTHQNPRPK